MPLLTPRGLRTSGWERLLYNTAKQGQLGTVQPTNQVHCFRNGPSVATKYLTDLINQKKPHHHQQVVAFNEKVQEEKQNARIRKGAWKEMKPVCRAEVTYG